MNKLFTAFNKKKSSSKSIIIVSGLPRSGTSMMMKMLAEGGLQIVTDEVRRADDDNPNGYFEFETVKSLPEGEFTWLKQADGKVVKVISSLLEYLPAEYSYKVIFMERDLKEILVSQRKMLLHRNEPSKLDDSEMEQQFRNHLAVIKAWLIRQANFEVLYVNFSSLLADPKTLCNQICDFIDTSLNVEHMLSVPSETLYRNRMTTSP